MSEKSTNGATATSAPPSLKALAARLTDLAAALVAREEAESAARNQGSE